MAFRNVRNREDDISPYHKPNYGHTYPEPTTIKRPRLDSWSLDYLLHNPSSELASIDMKVIFFSAEPRKLALLFIYNCQISAPLSCKTQKKIQHMLRFKITYTNCSSTASSIDHNMRYGISKSSGRR